MARKAQPTKDDPKVEAAAGAEAEAPEAPTEEVKAAAEQSPEAAETSEENPTPQDSEEEGGDNPEDDSPEEDGKPVRPRDKATPATTARMVEAKLRTRHCRGGICKEKGQTMPMTQGEYERLKQYGRVE
ncbi:hypothetical protein [Halomonas rhizosphaerae]|uniref:Uncharacterized protein n=1 Tax=Halomonas rhizosphaerae TaxID=3043296 RepID=A0ABT6UXB2_9GAMM|nr:hypothetical protein [Halomonas rhizosphaerae]MDI5890607.1 hypothetical protein [Halomonas rhizosphaerae]